MTTMQSQPTAEERLLAPLLGRINDMDSHEMTPANKWAENFGDAGALLAALFQSQSAHTDELAEFGEFGIHVEGDSIAVTTESVWKRSGWEKAGPKAPGAIDMQRRIEVLDLMGVRSQLVFPTFGLIGMILTASPIVWLESMFGGFPEGITEETVRSMGVAVSTAWNDWAIEQQQIDGDRLRMVGVSQTGDLDALQSEIERLADGGVHGVWIPASTPPGGLSPADPLVDPLWRRCAELDMVVYLHLAFEDFTRTTAWGDVPQFAYDTVKSAEYIADPYSMSTAHQVVENYLYTMVLGGVFERHPDLRFGVIECGAHWAGPMAENMDKWARVFRKRMAGLLSMPPSAYLSRNVRVTPFWFEDVNKYVSRYGLEDIYVYGSDYPHIEGGTDQLNTYARMIEGMDGSFAEKFFVSNAGLLLPGTGR